jgi:hypothetical protein
MTTFAELRARERLKARREQSERSVTDTGPPEPTRAEPVPIRPATPPDNGRPLPPTRSLVGVEAAAVVERPVERVWRHRLLRGALNLLAGQPEAGKSSIALDLIARLTQGATLPDGAPSDAAPRAGAGRRGCT